MRVFDAFLRALALVLVVLSIIFMVEGQSQTGWLLLLLSILLFITTVPRPPPPIEPVFSVSTEVICEGCGHKYVRPFKKGDYVFKEVEECPRCKKPMIITAIFRKPTKEELS